ncbi:MAG: TrmH family RNA methyltransferase [Tangfeifania sp.]
MISKNTIKLIKSLFQKKYRHKHRLFLVEGDKNVVETLQSEMNVEQLFATDEFIHNNRELIENAERAERASPGEIKKASLLKTPQSCLALCTLPDEEDLPEKPDVFSFYLDGVRDPGNLGTIIRTCDWFGINQLFCSEDTVDVFNPKVIQATMGSFCRVKIFYAGFEKVEEMANLSGIKVLGTFMDGVNIYQSQLPGKALVVLGNEGSGIRKEIENAVTQKISIPRFANNNNKPESLNVAVSAAIICSEFKRKSTT